MYYHIPALVMRIQIHAKEYWQYCLSGREPGAALYRGIPCPFGPSTDFGLFLALTKPRFGMGESSSVPPSSCSGKTDLGGLHFNSNSDGERTARERMNFLEPIPPKNPEGREGYLTVVSLQERLRKGDLASGQIHSQPC
jgi:hypothetical protein